MRTIHPWTAALVFASLALSGCSQSNNGAATRAAGGDKPNVTSSPLAITGPNQVILEVAGMS